MAVERISVVQSDARKEGADSSENLRVSHDVSPPRHISYSSEQMLASDETADFVFRAPARSVLTLGGTDSATLRGLLDETEHDPNDRRALFVRLRPAPSVEACVEQAIALLAETAFRLWPVWFTDVSFAMCGNDALGRQTAGTIAREAASGVPGINVAWAERAARLALDDRTPRVDGILPVVELAQLSLAISRAGLILVVDADAAAIGGTSASALVHALEWIAQHSGAAVVAVFPELPALTSPFDRILCGARRVIAEADAGLAVSEPEGNETVGPETWLVPWRGLPHPLSEIEQRLAAMLGADGELAALFRFNWFVDTVRGSRPKVDLVWTDGRLVVELDGYPDHSTRRAFIGDRHRDYELMLSGYTVLRLANDEVAQDYGRAIEKIRALVRLRRMQMNEEG
jgi:very-short-patch-repair endonuclease